MDENDDGLLHAIFGTGGRREARAVRRSRGHDVRSEAVEEIPVIDDRGELVSVVTLGDLARETRREQGEHLVRAISAPLGSSQRAAA